MFKLGLTGSIGMGKSTTAAMFKSAGCAVWDADAAVHRLYEKGGAAVGPIKALVSNAVVDGAVSRAALKEAMMKDPELLKKIEAIVHPLVAQDRAAFLKTTTAGIVVFDIPILFETGGDAAMDAVVCVSVPPDVQRQRVLERGTMTPEQLEEIMSKQMPNDEKCARADYVIVTDTLDHALEQVEKIVSDIRGELTDA